MAKNKEQVLELYKYKYHMENCSSDFEELHCCYKEIERLNEKNDGGVLLLCKILSILFGGLGAFGIFYQVCLKYMPNLIVTPAPEIYNFCFFNKIIPYILVFLSIIYYGVCYAKESKKNKVYKNELFKKNKIKEQIILKIQNHHKKYENPPVDFRFSDPAVLDIIINYMERHEDLSLEEALKNIYVYEYVK